MHENSDLVRLVVNSFRKDLDDINETNNCLALHAIANIGGKEMAESLAEDVHRLLISPLVLRGFGILLKMDWELTHDGSAERRKPLSRKRQL